MSHELSYADGRYEAFVAGGKPAWHNPSTNIPVLAHLPVLEEAITTGHLDWQVEKVPLFSEFTIHAPLSQESPHTEYRQASKIYGIRRCDTGLVLGAVGDKYVPIQNRQAFEFLQKLADDDQITFESAGALFGGRQVWVLARIPGTVTVGTDDHLFQFLLFNNRHDGFGAGDALPTDVRVVCANTQRRALAHADARRMKIRHTGNIEQKIADAQRAIGIVTASAAQLAERGTLMARHKLTPVSFNEYLNTVMPLKPETLDRTIIGKQPEAALIRKRERVRDLFSQPETNEADGTLWGAYNAITHLVDHDWKNNGKTDTEKYERRMRNAMLDGPGVDLKSKAWDVALELVGA